MLCIKNWTDCHSTLVFHPVTARIILIIIEIMTAVEYILLLWLQLGASLWYILQGFLLYFFIILGRCLTTQIFHEELIT